MNEVNIQEQGILPSGEVVFRPVGLRDGIVGGCWGYLDYLPPPTPQYCGENILPLGRNFSPRYPSNTIFQTFFQYT
ncbi:MAG: hypothetical protein BWY04_01209 [candidate division CPR1 bacterium ADurb.Bin160]|uniref:Uncharacterized protein n=1 Tax=candidate division CPR1 bacterium ADurb.Bin160 TaxID=1852826 RepID=A0A1V5ZKQ7_9BACT|nr:MAG: hypothetical protein BWY04_01209 [candidate division CPR1 bacterium ADurb.Bin160]